MRRLCLAAVVLAFVSCGSSPPATERKLVILAVEGLDPTFTERLIREGRLPNLASLARDGQVVRVASTPAAEATSAWAAFATGTNAGKHGLFDFVMPDLTTGRPSTPALAVAPPAGILTRWMQGATYLVTRQGEPFWTTLGRTGVRTAMLFVPGTFPPEPVPAGRMLAGTPLPDWGGAPGSGYTWLASDVLPSEVGATRYGGRVERLTFSRNVAHATLIGIREPERVDLPLTITWNPEARSANIEIGDQMVYLAEGQHSRWVEVAVRLNLVTRVRGLVRLHLVKAGNDVQLYVSPIQWHPEHPPSPIGSPRAEAATMFERLGEYRTLAWPEAAWALADGYMSEAAFVSAQDEVFVDRAEALLNRVESADWDLVVAGIESIDTTTRMMWRLIDRGHAAYDAALATRFGGAIERMYVQLDTLVKQVRDRLPPEGDLAVVSTYGTYTARHLVDLNRWLTDEGLLTWSQPPPPVSLAALADPALWPDAVDWTATAARAMGAGHIYVNLRGRDPHGIVEPGAPYEALLTRLRQRLETLTDPVSGGRVVARVRTAAETFDGPLLARAPDLVVSFSPGYRASWDSMLGGMADSVVAGNRERWSAEHASVDEQAVPGAWLSSMPLLDGGLSVLDIAPTVLAYFKRLAPPHWDGTARLGAR